jgi:hypothetical protein
MEEPKRLIPYSVHLREDIYKKLKAAAGDRKASALVRDAITFIVEGDDSFNSGYRKGLRDAIDAVNAHKTASAISFGGATISASIVEKIEKLLPATPKAKNGNKKTAR